MIRKAPGNFFEFSIGLSRLWISLQEEIFLTNAVAVGQIWSEDVYHSRWFWTIPCVPALPYPPMSQLWTWHLTEFCCWFSGARSHSKVLNPHDPSLRWSPKRDVLNIYHPPFKLAGVQSVLAHPDVWLLGDYPGSYRYINVAAHIYKTLISWDPYNFPYLMAVSRKRILSFLPFPHKYNTTFIEFKKVKNTSTNIFEKWFPEDAMSRGCSYSSSCLWLTTLKKAC